MNANTTWTLAGSPYLVDFTVLVQNGVTLTIEPGVVVKVKGWWTVVGVNTGGSLIAVGTAENRIIFTSLQDDSIAGDSAGDGATFGAPGQWRGVTVDGGTAQFKYVDVKYSGQGTGGPYGAVTLSGNSTADIDYCDFYQNQETGLSVQGSTATVKHSKFRGNKIGVYSSGGIISISHNSRLSENSDTGLFLNYVSTYSGPKATISNSEIKDNLQYGVKLVVDPGIAAAYAPFGSGNNIYDNGSAAGVGGDKRQLWTLHLLTQSDWRQNYWGTVFAIPCPVAPPTTQVHLSYDSNLDLCADPRKGPTMHSTYLGPSCPDKKPQRCASDWVTNFPHSPVPIDNSGW
jgi:hypothetical protein